MPKLLVGVIEKSWQQLLRIKCLKLLQKTNKIFRIALTPTPFAKTKAQENWIYNLVSIKNCKNRLIKKTIKHVSFEREDDLKKLLLLYQFSKTFSVFNV